jgi:hypothetical protein
MKKRGPLSDEELAKIGNSAMRRQFKLKPDIIWDDLPDDCKAMCIETAKAIAKAVRQEGR